MPSDLTAAAFTEQLNERRSDEQREKYRRYFKMDEGEYGEGDVFIGVPMGQVFALAKTFIDMPVEDLETLLESPIHEARAGAMSIMDKATRQKKISETRRRELYDLYLRRHDRINNWDLVDLGAPFVIGGYLRDKPRDILITLAGSENLWKRRTAITATAYFLRQGEAADTFTIAEILANDIEDLIHKATGGWLRVAGDIDPDRLFDFLDRHAATMPRVMLRYTIEHLTPEQRKHYMGVKAG